MRGQHREDAAWQARSLTKGPLVAVAPIQPWPSLLRSDALTTAGGYICLNRGLIFRLDIWCGLVAAGEVEAIVEVTMPCESFDIFTFWLWVVAAGQRRSPCSPRVPDLLWQLL